MKTKQNARLSIGVRSLDEILHGGLLTGRAYLVRGGPGTGKTTLGLHFLMAGATNGEKTLFVSLGEREEQVRWNAEALAFDLRGITILDLSPTPEFFAEVQSYDIFMPAEVEREPTTRKIIEQVEALKPRRVFVDAITQFRYLSTDPFQFRRQVLSFLRFLSDQGATVLLSSEVSPAAPDDDLQFMCDGVIDLDVSPHGRTVRVIKLHGSGFEDGPHAMRLTGVGMAVFPHLVPEAYGREFIPETIAFGIPELDGLLHGGLERGTTTIISGPTGVGKTNLGLQFVNEAAGRGERSVVYVFEEWVETLLRRSEAINIPIRAMVERDTLSLVPVEPLEHTPDEFARLVRREVEEQKARIVMIDSTSGYQLSMRGEDLASHLHALCKYLKNMGVTIILINEVEDIAGDFRPTELGISYIADNIVFLRYIEVSGELRRAIGVLKKRVSDFEKTLRELEITGQGIKVGKPLTNLRGILKGTPEWAEPPK